MKKFLHSLGQFSPQTVNAIRATINCTIENGKHTELKTETLTVIATSQGVNEDEINVLILDSSEEFYNNTLRFIYNNEGEFFTAIVFNSEPKPEPKQLSGENFLMAIIKGATNGSIDLRKNLN